MKKSLFEEIGGTYRQEGDYLILNLAQAMALMDETAAFLAGLPHEERLNWLKEHQYSHPISFEREIGGILYTVNAHFNSEKIIFVR